MGRLTSDQWEQVKADYEVRGTSLKELAKRYGVDRAAISRKAKKEGWIQGKSHTLVERKVTAIKEIAQINSESHTLPVTFQHTIDSVVKERLQADGLMASLDVAICAKAIELARAASSPEELESLSRTRKNLAPQIPKEGTTVNVQQANCASIPANPRDTLAELVREAKQEE